MSVQLIVLRHGSTPWNRERRYQGCVDTRLSGEGRAQAAAAAESLAAYEVAAVYASPLGRAQETAVAIAGRHRLPVLPAPEFKEICLGRWEGLTVPEVEARFPDAFAAWRDHPDVASIPEGESLAEVRGRVLAGLRRLLAPHAGQTICLVAHGVTIRLLILEALGLSPARLWSVQVRPAAISELAYGDGWATVHRMNILVHLDGLARTAAV